MISSWEGQGDECGGDGWRRGQSWRRYSTTSTAAGKRLVHAVTCALAALLQSEQPRFQPSASHPDDSSQSRRSSHARDSPRTESPPRSRASRHAVCKGGNRDRTDQSGFQFKLGMLACSWAVDSRQLICRALAAPCSRSSRPLRGYDRSGGPLTWRDPCCRDRAECRRTRG